MCIRDSLCAERKLPGIGGQNLLQGYPCCYRKRKRVETVPGNSLRTAPDVYKRQEEQRSTNGE